MGASSHPRSCHAKTIDSFFGPWFFKLLSPIYHKKKKLKTVLTYFLKFFLFIFISPWTQPGANTFRPLKEKAPFRGWGVGERVCSGLSAALSLWIALDGRKCWRKRGASCRRRGIFQRKPPLGGGGWAGECVAVHPLRSRLGTSETLGGSGISWGGFGGGKPPRKALADKKGPNRF